MVDYLMPRQWGEEAERAQSVRRGDDQSVTQLPHRFEERTGRVNMLQNLRGDHKVSPLKAESSHSLGVGGVNSMSCVAAFRSPRDTLGVNVQPDQRRCCLDELGVQPRPRLDPLVEEWVVGKPDMDHGPTVGGIEEEAFPVDRSAVRELVEVAAQGFPW